VYEHEFSVRWHSRSQEQADNRLLKVHPQVVMTYFSSGV